MENKYAWGDIHTGGHICLRGYICTEEQRLMEGIHEDKYVHGDKSSVEHTRGQYAQGDCKGNLGRHSTLKQRTGEAGSKVNIEN